MRERQFQATTLRSGRTSRSAFILNAGQQVTGQGSLNSYSTKIYQKVFSSDSQIALLNALNATFGILFTLNAVWIIDRFGRKFLLIVGGIGMGICMVIAAAVETETPNLPGGAKSESVGIAIEFLLFLFIFFCQYPLPPPSSCLRLLCDIINRRNGKDTTSPQTSHHEAPSSGSGPQKSSA